ncbi:MAG: ABC transporter ATP-binding protein/permease [Pseudomonadota bacterium]|nr:ABC transporter ATP-binding protein/permease [Pseudomonadota bacterium]
MAFLVLGGILMGFVEYIGLWAFFPLILVVQSPDKVQHGRVLGPIYHFLGMTDPAQFTVLVGLGVIGIFILKNLIWIGYLRFEFSSLVRWRVNLSRRFYQGYLRAPYEIFLQRSSSDMIAVISSVIPYVINNFVHQFITLFNLLLTAVIIAVVLFKLYSQVALVFVSAALILFWAHSRIIKKSVERTGAQTQKLSARQFSVLQQTFRGYKDTRLHHKTQLFSRDYSKLVSQLSREEERIQFLQTLPAATIEIIIMSLAVGAFLFFVYQSDSGAEAVAKLGTLGIIAFRIIPVINRSITATTWINSSKASLDRLFSEARALGILEENAPDESRERDSALPAPLPFRKSLKFRNVTYTYPKSEVPVLDRVDFSVTPGEFVGITGASGSGKTSLVNILLHFLPPRSGEVLLDGQRLDATDIERFHRITGYVDQQPFLLNADIAHNVAFGDDAPDIDMDRVVSALKKAGLWEFVRDLEKGVETQVGEDGKLLSGGQRQRLAIARAFYKDIRILVLDEASAAMDMETEHRFFEFLYGLKGEMTVIMIAHRLSTLKHCDRILFMENGRITDQGSFAALYDHNDHFRNYVEYARIRVGHKDQE